MILLNKFIANYITYSDLTWWNAKFYTRFTIACKEVLCHEDSFLGLMYAKKEYAMHDNFNAHNNHYRIIHNQIHFTIYNDACQLKVEDDTYFKFRIQDSIYATSIIRYNFNENYDVSATVYDRCDPEYHNEYYKSRHLDYNAYGDNLSVDHILHTSHDVSCKNFIKEYKNAYHDKNLPFIEPLRYHLPFK